MQHWYVYYKLPRSERAAVIEQVRSMQRELAHGNLVKACVLERCENPSEATTTMMEVYEGIAEPARFGAALETAVRTSGLAPEHVDARRVERFQDT